MYDDILYYDDNKIKETMMKQTFLINKGYFDPKSYFPSLNVTSLDDNTFDKKILGFFKNFFFKINGFLEFFKIFYSRYAKPTKCKCGEERTKL